MIKNKSETIKFERVWSMPNKNTFEINPIKKLISEEVCLENQIWLDPFANQNKIATITNDLNTDYNTDYHLDALEFLKLFDDESVDGILYDPPYSPRQVSECYNNVGFNVTWDTTKASFWSNHKKEISRILKKNGKVITFGWNSGGIGFKYGFEIQRILLVPHGGWHNDTICTVETKTHDRIYNKKEKELKKIELNEIDKKLVKELNSFPIDYWDFKNADTKEYTHGIHNYPAMMVSPISRNIISIMKKYISIDSILDPYAGSGTVLVEGMLAGISKVAGNDINPLALLLTKVKTTPLDIRILIDIEKKLIDELDYIEKETNEIFYKLRTYINEELDLDITARKGWGDNAPYYLNQFCNSVNLSVDIPDFKNIGYWFKPSVIISLSLIKKQINTIKDEDYRDFVYLAFSETLRLVSNRRNGEFKMYRMPVNKLDNFNPNVFEKFIEILSRNVTKMNDFSEIFNESNIEIDVQIYKNNTCELDSVPNNEYNLVITSPPYGDSRTTVAYGEYSRLSLQWIDLFNLNHKEIMGVDKSLMGGKKYRNGFEMTVESTTLRAALEKISEVDLERAGDVYSFYEDLNKSLEEISKKTKSGGYHFWVVGNRTVKSTLLETDKIISELARQHSLIYVHTISRNIPNKVMPSLNSPSNKIGDKISTMTMEHIVVLRKE